MADIPNLLLVERVAAVYKSGYAITKRSMESTVHRFATLDEARREAVRLSTFRDNIDWLIINPKTELVVATYRAGKER